MQTIEEYKEYTKQLEGEVGKWHHAYDALIVERNQLVNNLLKYEKTVSIRNEEGSESVVLLRETFDAISGELDELRKHEVEWDLAQARIKELEAEKRAKADKINALHQKSLARLEELVNKKYPDEEEDHINADVILCEMLDALGYKDLINTWDKVKKWYS